MSKSKKVLASLLSALMIATTVTIAPITASATDTEKAEEDYTAELTTDTAECTTEENAEISDTDVNTADEESEIATPEKTDVGVQSNETFSGKITFEIPENWREYNRSYYAHIWNGLSGDKLYSWQTSAEKMTVNADETLATYNVPNGDWNLIIISGDSGVMTYDSVFNKNCIGDTCYAVEDTTLSPSNSASTMTSLFWRNNPDCGPHKTINNLGEIKGTSLIQGETNKTLYNDFIKKYAPETGTVSNWNDYGRSVTGMTWEQITTKVANELGLATEEVGLDTTTLTLGVGETFTLSASTNLLDLDSTTFAWASSNYSVADIRKTTDKKAVVTAKKVGTTDIIVKTSTGKTAICKLTVKNAPSSVKLSVSTLTLGVGDSFVISESTNSGSYAKSFTWSSSDTSVAIIQKTTANQARITPKKVGTTTITIKTYNGKTATCKLTVKNAPTSVNLSVTKLTLGVGETFVISESTNSGSYAKAFTWSSANESIATIKKTTANKAVITAKNTGTTTVKIKTYNGKTATCNITVKNAPTSVKLSVSSLTLGVGEKFIISESTNSGSYAKAFTWSSSNASVATVAKTTANKAVITAKKVGTTNITIKTYNGKTATCKLTVKNAPSSVKLSKTSLTIKTDETYVISESTNSGSYAKSFTWSSSNSSVATVTKTTANKAVITAKRAGTTTITIKTYNGKTATCKVTVKQNNYEMADILINRINQERSAHGMNKLTKRNDLCAIATIRAKELSQKFDLERPDGTTVADIMDVRNINYQYVIEDGARVDSSANRDELFNQWLQTEYQQELMHCELDSIGVGYYKDSSGTEYWSLLYVIE